MTVTVVSDVLGPENNGTTIAAMNLIRHLRGAGHTVRVLCSDQDKKGLADHYIVPNLNLGAPLNTYVKKVGVSLSKPEEKVIREALEGADAVHIMFPFLLAFKAAKMAKDMGLPITAGFHMQAQNFTSYIKMNWCAPANRAVYKIAWRHLYRYADAIHYPTEFIKNIFESEIKRSTNGYVISNGVHSYVERRNLQKPTEFEDKFVILTVGRYSREKAQDTLLKAVALSAHKENIQLILAGQGVKERYYRKLAKKLPNPPVFKLYGRNELIDELNRCDLYVHPAEMELEGISCLEAIACGKATVVSDSALSATKEFAVDESCIFRNRNPKDLARVIDHFIENSEARRACGEKYYASAHVYSQAECMQKMEEMIFEVRRAKQEKE
jgi:glycosyltransferase involved in cell wall biosynthesis